MTLNAVRNYRAKRGIQAAGRTGSAVSPTEVGAALSFTGGEAAWRVTAEAETGQSVRVVVAPSLAEAANRAEAAGLGQIVALEWIGAVV